MPSRYDSTIGERGVTLSGGHRQPIGIARALVRNAPILILDEPTAALDTESEKLLMEGLDRLMQGRTVITITHRLNTIRDADDANPAFDLTHEKSMVVHDHTAFVQSLNWTAKNMTETRDYAVVTKSGHDVAEVVSRLQKVARDDWEHSHPLDLSDEGLLADLEGRIGGSAGMLGIDAKGTREGD